MNYDMHSTSLVEDIGPAVVEPDFKKYQANTSLHLRNMETLSDFVCGFMKTAGLPNAISSRDLSDYFDAMSLNQAFNIYGTTPGNGTLWLFLLARSLKPTIIAESGVFRGSSLFTLKNAMPHAKIFAFDLDFSNLLTRLDGVDYRQQDWGTDNVRAESPSDLCHFNDHINSCMRIRQCYERGFKHLILDDSPDIGEIHQFRYPAVPTFSMIENDKWSDGDTCEWNWNGRRLRYTFRTADTFGAKELIDAAYRLPSLKRWTGMEDSWLYYVVRLKDSIGSNKRRLWTMFGRS